jgi:hypothetical protein
LSCRVQGGGDAIGGLLNQAAATLIRDASWLGYESPPRRAGIARGESAPSRYKNIATDAQARLAPCRTNSVECPAFLGCWPFRAICLCDGGRVEHCLAAATRAETSPTPPLGNR